MEGKREWKVEGLRACRWVIFLAIFSPVLACPLSASGASNFYSYNKPLPIPGFSLENLQGKTVSIKDFKGKVVLLHFWATW